MKRLLIILMILSIVVSGILIVFSRDLKNTFNIEKPEVLQKLQVNPIAYMVDDNQTYNFIYPFYNEMESFYLDETVTIWTLNKPITIQVDGINTEIITYSIIEPLTDKELMRDIVSKSDITNTEKGIRISIMPEGLEKEKRYVLNIEVKVEGKVVNFYQSMLLTEHNQENLIKLISDTHSLMYEGDKDYMKYIKGNNAGGIYYDADQDSSEDVLSWASINDFVKMNEPIPEILSYNPKTGSFQVRLKYIIAMRKAYEFEYWDFTELYFGTLNQGEIKINKFERKGNKKNQPYFDNEQLQWVLDEGANREESSSIISENEEYLGFVYKNEVWLLNKTYNELTKVFGFDTLDSDYIMDEGNQHKIKLLELDNKGNMKYLVYGYMAAGDFVGYNGILINEYHHKKMENESLLFIKLSKDYHVLEYFIENASFYNEKENILYIAMQREIYKIDVKAGSFKQVMELSSYMDFSKDGMLYSSNPSNKENLSIQLIDLTSDKIDDNGQQIMLENTYIRAIGSIKDGLIIGAYDLQATYENLDGTVFYPYNEIYLIEHSGKTNKIISADKQTYFQDLEINKKEGFISSGVYNLERKGNNVIYKKSDERIIYQFEPESIITEQVLENVITSDQNTIRIKHSSTSLSEDKVPVASTIHKKYVLLDTHLTSERQIYEIYNNNYLVGISSELREGLQLSKTKNASQLYLVNNKERLLIYDTSKQPNSILIDVPIMAQRPELIRGCESTALAMFLSYYKGQEVSKTALAEKIRRDETPKTYVNGMISFGDMHKGFVGSMTNRAQPGLGVYAEPVYELAKEYIEGVHNITGASFEQVLSFVGNGQPVWVITPANYNKVSEYVIQQWITPSGYMEVTYLEHSVVIVGYDETYVYLNDPQQGRVIKQPRFSFQVGWENQGSQAIVVIQ